MQAQEREDIAELQQKYDSNADAWQYGDDEDNQDGYTNLWDNTDQTGAVWKREIQSDKAAENEILADLEQ